MENSNIKRGRGRPKLYTAEERKNHKSTYMLNKPWYCDVCKTERNYTLAGKSCHLKTKNILGIAIVLIYHTKNKFFHSSKDPRFGSFELTIFKRMNNNT